MMARNCPNCSEEPKAEILGHRCPPCVPRQVMVEWESGGAKAESKGQQPEGGGTAAFAELQVWPPPAFFPMARWPAAWGRSTRRFRRLCTKSASGTEIDFLGFLPLNIARHSCAT